MRYLLPFFLLGALLLAGCRQSSAPDSPESRAGTGGRIKVDAPGVKVDVNIKK